MFLRLLRDISTYEAGQAAAVEMKSAAAFSVLK